jgi:alkylation response protein AidB-like acyl-CoA dehydrogenase
VNFTVTEEEEAVLAAAAEVAVSADPWTALVEGGWLDLVADDPAVGLAYTGLVAESLGAAAVAVPLIGTAVVWPTLFGTSAGARRVAVGEDGLAEDAVGADLLIVFTEGSASAYSEFSAEPVGGLEGDGLAAVISTGEPVERCTDPARVELARRRVAAVAAAEMAGALGRISAMTTAYVQERQQFGRPVSAFQAVAHGAAQLATLAEAARWSARIACQAQEPVDMHAAKGWISAASAEASAVAHQLHGAVGFTEEYGLARLTKRLRSLRFAWGDDGTHHLSLARLTTA